MGIGMLRRHHRAMPDAAVGAIVEPQTREQTLETRLAEERKRADQLLADLAVANEALATLSKATVAAAFEDAAMEAGIKTPEPPKAASPGPAKSQPRRSR